MGLNGGGYTFIKPQDLATLTNDEVQAMFTDKTSFLMRVRHSNSTQPYAVLQQLNQFRYVLDLRSIICVLEILSLSYLLQICSAYLALAKLTV